MPTPKPYPPIHGRALKPTGSLLAHERLMSIGINRPDGWPQVTTVGYVNDGLRRYFVTGRESQKLANLKRDPRVSVSIHSNMDAAGAVGVSMAARAVEVINPVEVEQLNRMMFERWPSVSIYCPATSSIAIIQLTPELICTISASSGRSRTECFSISGAPGLSTSAEARLF